VLSTHLLNSRDFLEIWELLIPTLYILVAPTIYLKIWNKQGKTPFHWKEKSNVQPHRMRKQTPQGKEPNQSQWPDSSESTLLSYFQNFWWIVGLVYVNLNSLIPTKMPFKPSSRTSRSSENNCFPYVFYRLVVSCKFHSIFFANFVRQIWTSSLHDIFT
jgi:hypothetical protein